MLVRLSGFDDLDHGDQPGIIDGVNVMHCGVQKRHATGIVNQLVNLNVDLAIVQDVDVFRRDDWVNDLPLLGPVIADGVAPMDATADHASGNQPRGAAPQEQPRSRGG
jgi:hypothetical protein